MLDLVSPQIEIVSCITDYNEAHADMKAGGIDVVGFDIYKPGALPPRIRRVNGQFCIDETELHEATDGLFEQSLAITRNESGNTTGLHEIVDDAGGLPEGLLPVVNFRLARDAQPHTHETINRASVTTHHFTPRGKGTMLSARMTGSIADFRSLESRDKAKDVKEDSRIREKFDEVAQPIDIKTGRVLAFRGNGYIDDEHNVSPQVMHKFQTKFSFMGRWALISLTS